MAATEGSSEPRPANVELAFKNPSRPLNDTFQMQCGLHTSIKQVKEMLQAKYPGNPASDAITLIYAGKVLKEDTAPLSAYFNAEASPVALHIVVRQSASSTSSGPPAIAPGTTAIATPPEVVPPEQPPAPRPVPLPTEPVAQTVAASPAPTVRPSALSPIPTMGRSSSQARPSAQEPSVAAAKEQPPSSSIPSPAGMFGAQLSGYTSAYQAAYQAALQALISQQQANGTTQATAANNGQPPAVAVLPAMMPQPVLPATMFTNATASDASPSSSNATTTANPRAGAPNPPAAAPQILYPMVPMPYAMPMHPLQALHYREAELRYRRERAAVANDEVLALARVLQEHGAPLPNDLLERLQRRANERGDGGARQAARPRRRGFQLRIQINVRALLQLAVLMVVVYQHCPPKRFAILCVVGFLLWLSTTSRVRAFLQVLAGLRPRQPVAAVPPPAPQQQQPNAGADAGVNEQAAHPQQPEAAALQAEPAQVPAAPVDAPAVAAAAPNEDALPPPDAPDAPAAAPHPERHGIIREIHAFIAGFITSLLPAMDNNDDPVQADAGPMRDAFRG